LLRFVVRLLLLPGLRPDTLPGSSAPGLFTVVFFGGFAIVFIISCDRAVETGHALSLPLSLRQGMPCLYP
jgi:hypothetical protein